MVEIAKNLLAALHSLFKSRFELQAEILVFRHQLNVLRRKVKIKPRLTSWDRLLLVWLYLSLLKIRFARSGDECRRVSARQ